MSLKVIIDSVLSFSCLSFAPNHKVKEIPSPGDPTMMYCLITDPEAMESTNYELKPPKL
jgi:hypothetical protein